MINNSGVLDVNDTELNTTITNIVNEEASFWEIAVVLSILFTVTLTTYNFTLLDGQKSDNRGFGEQ